MKAYFLLLCWRLVFPMVTFAQANDTERTIVKVEETERQKKTITELFKGDKLIRKHVEVIRTGNKPVEVKYTCYYQDGKEVLFECWDSKSKISTRYFKVNNQLVMAEIDRDGDGLFEWVVIYGEGEKVSSVFRRTKDGGIEMLDGDALDTFKKGSDAAKKLFER